MTVVSSGEYEAKKKEFLQRHEDWQVETSPMDEYDRYYKTYACMDGAQWIEVNMPVVEKVEFSEVVHGYKVTLTRDVRFLQTEGRILEMEI